MLNKMEKGGGIQRSNSLLEKYDIIRLLGEGLSGKVYLVKHKSLDVYRAMKVVPIKKSFYDTYKREVTILKTLKYSGIPIIYDMEEVADKLYIIEEYIQGETLYERVSYVGTMSLNELIHFGISLCQPIKYLHNQENPIYHLDLQPSNLILKENTVNLIDFDHALLTSDNQSADTDGYGTVGYAAPEQFARQKAEKETDIYAIGALLYYAGTGNRADLNNLEIPEGIHPLKELILNCLSFDKKLRYESVEEVEAKLKELLKSKKTEPSYNIAVAALSKSAGASTIALHFGIYLKKKKISAVYEECNYSGHMSALGESIDAERDEYGYFKFHKLPIRQKYNETIDLPKHSAAVYIKDYGTDINKAYKSKSDLLILISNSALWNLTNNYHILSKLQLDKTGNYILIFNLYKDSQKIFIPETVDKKSCFRFPYIQDISRQCDETTKLYEHLTERLYITCGKKEGLISSLKKRMKERLKL